MLANEELPEGMNGGLKMSIKFEDVVLPSAEQWRAIIIGARNPMNSWEKSDSHYCNLYDGCEKTRECDSCPSCYEIGSNDLNLMKRLRNAGTDHRKFMRMIPVIVTITAPLYWWKEFDTYKVGTVANSCSTMHKIAAKEFTLEDFSCEHLIGVKREWIDKEEMYSDKDFDELWSAYDALDQVVRILNFYREKYLATKDKKYWWQMIQLLPTSYNQKRTIDLNYENLINMYHARKNHKLDEWHDFCDWIESLPYAKELIIGGELGEDTK